MICLSNYFAIIFSYLFASVTFNFLPHAQVDILEVTADELHPFFTFPHFKILKNEISIVIGFALGLYFSIYRSNKTHNVFEKLQWVANQFLKKVFLPVLPLFILGFLLKLEHEAVLHTVIKRYAPIFILFVLSQMLYVIVLLLTISKFKLENIIRYIKNTLPATLTGFTTLSSAATMPITIIAAEKNSGLPMLSRMLIPATVNIHMIGTSIGMNILILGTLFTFTNEIPTFAEYSYFALYFAVTQFAVVAIPGGVIFSIIPLLESQLGFTPEMIGVVSTLVMLFDPVDTSFNVTINALFVVLFGGVYTKLKTT